MKFRQSWASLATLFEREISKRRAKLSTSRELTVPPGVDGLGRTQLNELLANTPYHQERPEYFMDRRIGMSAPTRAKIYHI